MLRPSQFADEVGDPTNFDRKESKWVLADRQNDITVSQYGRLLNANYTPDLRGMFLRGMNEGRNDGKQDPQKDRNAGEYQEDAFASHRHVSPFSYYGQNFEKISDYKTLWIAVKMPDGTWYMDRKEKTEFSGSAGETRPKNVAVYYYIKIN